MSPPQLIIFEGVDAAGKSTVCGQFLSALKGRNLPARFLSFPGKTPRTLGHLVYRLHHDPSSVGVDGLTPASLQALHIAAHLDAIESVIVPCLEAGETIVLDRYWWSTWVYGVVGGIRANVLEALIEAERRAWGKWQPGILFHVTRSTPLRDESSDTWRKLQTEYNALAKGEAGKYPIQILSNNGELEDAVSKAIVASHGG
jgi:thymidylate kinase